MKKIDFFKKGFKLNRKIWCPVCKDTTMHTLELIGDMPKDERVHTLALCHDCHARHEAAQMAGKASEHPVYYQVFFTNAYVFLVLHPGYYDP